MAEMTPGRRAVAAALMFLLAAALAGISPGDSATTYRVFWLPEGLLAFLLTFALIEGRVWQRSPGPLGWIAIGYGTLANAQILTLLLPPPGIVSWVSLIGVLFLLLAALAMSSRRRLVGLLAGMSVLLAMIKFSVIPFLWVRSGPAPGEAFGLGTGLDRIRRLVVDYQPVPHEGQLLGLAAIGLWIMATRMLWDVPAENANAGHITRPAGTC